MELLQHLQARKDVTVNMLLWGSRTNKENRRLIGVVAGLDEALTFIQVKREELDERTGK